MEHKGTIFAETMEQLTLPLFQPLRLWSPRPARVRAEKSNTKELKDTSPGTVKTFAMKGGYISDSAGVRRMVIVGKIFRV